MNLSTLVRRHWLPAALLLLALPSLSFAQATRTWVSGVGDDANPCSRTAPCKTFAGAISKTAAGGEISVLDPGGFGGVTITKSITLTGIGAEAGVLVSGTNAIVINAADTDRVVLRGLTIEGLGTGLSGIRFLRGGDLVVEDTTIQNFRGNTSSYGISFIPSATSRLALRNVTLNANGQPGGGGGLLVSPGMSGQAYVTVQDSRMLNNTSGVRSNGRTVVSLVDSMIAGNSSSGTLAIGSSTEVSSMTIRGCTIANNGTANPSAAGVYANGALSIVRLSDNVVTGNSYGLRAVFDSNIVSFGNNVVEDNAIDGDPTATVPLR